jgi:hypothetical protein
MSVLTRFFSRIKNILLRCPSLIGHKKTGWKVFFTLFMPSLKD